MRKNNIIIDLTSTRSRDAEQKSRWRNCEMILKVSENDVESVRIVEQG